eukprot:2212026-Pleurochrysis_carterae.AAC.3
MLRNALHAFRRAGLPASVLRGPPAAGVAHNGRVRALPGARLPPPKAGLLHPGDQSRSDDFCRCMLR